MLHMLLSPRCGLGGPGSLRAIPLAAARGPLPTGTRCSTGPGRPQDKTPFEDADVPRLQGAGPGVLSAHSSPPCR